MSEEIDAKIADITRRFNDVQAAKTAAEEDVRTHDAELYRLQGEHRALKQLQELQSQTSVELDPADDALTLTAKPAKKES